jgi:hypothetical protein
MSAPATQRLGWHHLCLSVPAAWEVVRYRNQPDDGQLALADRHGEALVVFWHRAPKAPDLARAMAAVATPGPAGQPPAAAPCGEWLLHLPPTPDQPAYAGRHLATPGVLLVLVFPAHPQRQAAGVRQVLDSFQPNDGEERVWAAFGLDLTLPAAWRLAEIEALPACQRFTFETRHEETISLARFGLASRLLVQDDLATFAAHRKGRRTQLRRAGPVPRPDGAPGELFTYHQRGSGRALLGALLARTWEGRLWAWHRPDRERLWLLDHLARPRHALLDLPERVREP